jgi:predicted ATPase/class 3 adenylate cyclase
MSALPTGTVAMLFSDIEGSTSLLMRLGPAYAETLDAQRQVLRSAWATHGGTEMGTEGDSFFVVFPSAPAAVAAATDGQRELADYDWPGGEQVRVRMGIHVGNPVLHDGGYVGKDVHRAARIASTAHGGQVVVSEATAHLAQDDLPSGVELMDLGSHQLKDIPRPEHLFQLVLDGLPIDFPPLKTIGAVSNLPTPPTRLVGRDKELAELAEALALSRMRLVTLTGPGGSGKTRLAIEVALQLVNDFPDGVYFVSLVAVTTPDQLWTTIAEALDLRLPDPSVSRLLRHLAQRRALLVLDNLEQLPGAGAVVAELLAHAAQVAVLATSRRPLHVAAEHEHALTPLDVPDDASLDAAQQSGAVQLFVQQARRVRSSFALTAENAADVATLCRRLDGLPLALELAAARTKLLSPHALLARLDRALDMPAVGIVPDRQKTLRDTIAWSEELLTPRQRDFFHEMGVFSGGADLSAIAAVVTPDSDDQAADDLDLVSDLVDASLLTVRETSDGEPRIGMLQTVQIYAREQLTASGRHDVVRARHAEHYLGVAAGLVPLLSGDRRLEARNRFETEHDNFRGALDWALAPDPAVASKPNDIQAGLHLCLALNGFWIANAYLSEAQRWLELAVERARGRESRELARCLTLLARKYRSLGEPDRAYEYASRALAMARGWQESNTALLTALNTMAALEWDLSRHDAAHHLYEEAISVARRIGDRVSLHGCLVDLASLESSEHNYAHSLELGGEALAIARDLRHTVGALVAQHNMAWTLLRLGRVAEAQEEMCVVISQALDLDEPSLFLPVALDYAVVLATLEAHTPAVRLLGAVDAAHERLGSQPDPLQQGDRTGLIETTTAALASDDWNAAYETGRDTPIEDALAAAIAR